MRWPRPKTRTKRMFTRLARMLEAPKELKNNSLSFEQYVPDTLSNATKFLKGELNP